MQHSLLRESGGNACGSGDLLSHSLRFGTLRPLRTDQLFPQFVRELFNLFHVPVCTVLHHIPVVYGRIPGYSTEISLVRGVPAVCHYHSGGGRDSKAFRSRHIHCRIRLETVHFLLKHCGFFCRKFMFYFIFQVCLQNNNNIFFYRRCSFSIFGRAGSGFLAGVLLLKNV